MVLGGEDGAGSRPGKGKLQKCTIYLLLLRTYCDPNSSLPPCSGVYLATQTSSVRMLAKFLGSWTRLLSLTSRVRRLLSEPREDGSSLREFPTSTQRERNKHRYINIYIHQHPHMLVASERLQLTLQVERLQQPQVPD